MQFLVVDLRLVGPHGASALALYVEDHEMAINTLASKGFVLFTENDLQDTNNGLT